MLTAPDHHAAEVPEIPRQDTGFASRRHGHDTKVGKVGSAVGIAFGQLDDGVQLSVGWGVELVDTVTQRRGERRRSDVVAA